MEPMTPPAAWPLEDAAVTLALAARRVPWIDAPARMLGLRPLTSEGLTALLAAHLRRTRTGKPARFRTPFGSFLVPVAVDDVVGLLTAAHDVDGIGPTAGMDAGGRRVGLSAHAAMPDLLAALAPTIHDVVFEETSLLALAQRGADPVPWDEWTGATGRIARRVVVGAAAGGDTLLSGIAAESVRISSLQPTRMAALHRRLEPYLADPDPASVAGLLRAEAAGATERLAAVTHALSLVTDALTGTALQSLALIAVEPEHGVLPAAEHFVATALRQWPPVPMAVYRTTIPFQWNGLKVPQGTDILVVRSWLNTDQAAFERLPSPLCAAPEPCHATSLAAAVAVETVRQLTESFRPRLIAPDVSSEHLPETLNPHSVRIALNDPATPADPLGTGSSVTRTTQHAAAAEARAAELEHFAHMLAECSRDRRWNLNADGEQFRMNLLDHAERCRISAMDVRRAASRLHL